MTIGLSYRLRLQHPNTYLMFCPGCREVHELTINSVQEFSKRLGFDGDLRNPSFDPAVVVNGPMGVCIFDLRGGWLYYRGNCHHDLRGKRVELPAFPQP